MRAKYPDVENGFDFRATPDYSPRVPGVRLPAHVRERGQELALRHVLGQREWDMAREFHSVSFVSAPKHFPTKIQFVEIDEADLLWNALDSKAIGNVAPLEKTHLLATLGEVRAGKPRSVAMEDYFYDWIDPDSLEALAPLASQDVVLHFEGKVTAGKFAPVDVDDVDLELFD